MSTIVMEDKEVGSLEDLVQLVQTFRRDGKWIFRGVRQSNYELIPKIGRLGNRRGVGSPEVLSYDAVQEDTMTKHFIRSAGPYVRHVPGTRLEWLALGQHHGMFTRLLDWTESLLVAAFFAVEDARKREYQPMIYAVRDIPVVPEKCYDKIDSMKEDVMLYYPEHISPRIPAQSSVFTVHKHPDQAFVPASVVKLTIGRSPLTMKFNLNACGVHRASLFPDIDGLAQHQSWLYKWGAHLPYDA